MHATRTLKPSSKVGVASRRCYSNPIEVVAWSRGFSRIEPPEGSTPFHNLDRLAIGTVTAQSVETCEWT